MIFNEETMKMTANIVLSDENHIPRYREVSLL